MNFSKRALTSFLTVVGGIVVSVAKHPELIASLPGKIGTGVVLAAAVVSAVSESLRPGTTTPPAGE